MTEANTENTKPPSIEPGMAKEFIREFLTQPAGQYMLQVIQDWITDQHTERIALLELLQHKVDFTPERIDAVTQYAHYEAAGELLVDNLKEHVNLK